MTEGIDNLMRLGLI